jgi:hypothetical protein
MFRFDDFMLDKAAGILLRIGPDGRPARVGSGKNLVCLCRFQNDFGWFETPIQDRGSDQRDTMGTVGRPTHALLLAHPGVGNLVDTSFSPRTRDW